MNLQYNFQHRPNEGADGNDDARVKIHNDDISLDKRLLVHLYSKHAPRVLRGWLSYPEVGEQCTHTHFATQFTHGFTQTGAFLSDDLDGQKTEKRRGN